MTSETYQADPAEPLPTGPGGSSGAAGSPAGPGAVLSPTGRPRTATNTAEIGTAITHPGSVKINVKGAFIVDQGSSTPRNGQGSPTTHEHNGHQTKDIRLPNHTAVVSHVAIDVRSAQTV